LSGINGQQIHKSLKAKNAPGSGGNGINGENGNPGMPGGNIYVQADSIEGLKDLSIKTNGGNGSRG
jgi:hypothetical protein